MVNQLFPYYGGKQNLANIILPLFPKHIQYVEPFVGGGSIFFAKRPSDNEVLNDFDEKITNFYRVAKHPDKFKELQILIQGTLHSESDYLKSRDILKKFKASDSDVELAWALWCQCQLTFSHIIYGGFAFGETGMGRGTANKRDNFTEKLLERLRTTEIFQRDAVELILLKDSPNTFFYCDPPYVSSNCGHYKGYTTKNFTKLLNVLSAIKGKFLLSSYREEILLKYRDKYKWISKDIQQNVSVTGKRNNKKIKIECLTMNYQCPQTTIKLF